MPSKIILMPPLDGVQGPETEVGFDRPFTIAELLSHLSERTPGFRKFFAFDKLEGRPPNCLVVRGEHLLRLEEVVQPGETIEILAMVDGG